MKDEDYRDILQFTRKALNKAGLTAIDERIMSDIRGSEGPFWDLTYYLKHLTEEVALGSDIHLSNVLRRVRRHARTASEEPIERVRVVISDEDRERYDAKEIDFAPDPELGKVAEELRALIEELYEEHRRELNQRREE